MKWKYLMMIWKRERKVSDVWHYIVGHVREKLYYSENFRYLMRQHIRDQIGFRLNYMNKECYDKGSCIHCGCEVPALQMAQKPCEGTCYPELMSRKEWWRFSKMGQVIKQEDRIWMINANVLTLLKESPTGYVSEYKSKPRYNQREEQTYTDLPLQRRGNSNH